MNDNSLERYSRVRKGPTEELANESRSTHITVAADMVFSLSHFLSGVRIPYILRVFRLTMSLILLDCHCRFRPSALRCFMGRDSILRIVTAPASFQSAETRRDILLQHEPYSSGVVKSLGYSWRALQSSVLS